jgi:hypothetical protein
MLANFRHPAVAHRVNRAQHTYMDGGAHANQASAAMRSEPRGVARDQCEARNAYQDLTNEVLEQRGGTGSSSDQSRHTANAWIQGLSLRSRHLGGHRDHAHDRERPDEG